MTADADRFREEAIAAEQEQDWPWGAWTEQALARLWEEAGGKVPAPFDGITENDQQREEGRK